MMTSSLADVSSFSFGNAGSEPLKKPTTFRPVTPSQTTSLWIVTRLPSGRSARGPA